MAILYIYTGPLVPFFSLILKLCNQQCVVLPILFLHVVSFVFRCSITLSLLRACRLQCHHGERATTGGDGGSSNATGDTGTPSDNRGYTGFIQERHVRTRLRALLRQRRRRLGAAIRRSGQNLRLLRARSLLFREAILLHVRGDS